MGRVTRYRRGVIAIRASSALARFMCVALLGLLLALRVLSPAGFMPAFDHGTVTIVACPGDSAEPAGAMAAHGSGHSTHHEQCPYAAAAAPGALGHDPGTLAGSLVLAAALLLGRKSRLVERYTRLLRPPLRGPPITA